MATDPAGKNNGAGNDDAQMPRVDVALQYIRDLSFENVAAQKHVNTDVKPELSIQVNVEANKRAENRYEVILRLNASARDGDITVFVLEIDYAGQFVISNFPDAHLHSLLLLECPRLLFPFVRRIARDLTADGGFPPLNIDNVDFVSLYKSELARQKAKREAEGQSG